VPVITECDDDATAQQRKPIGVRGGHGRTRRRMGTMGAMHKRRARLRELAEPNLEGCAVYLLSFAGVLAGKGKTIAPDHSTVVRRLKLPAAGLGLGRVARSSVSLEVPPPSLEPARLVPTRSRLSASPDEPLSYVMAVR
jgi:hypothetical protein